VQGIKSQPINQGIYIPPSVPIDKDPPDRIAEHNASVESISLTKGSNCRPFTPSTCRPHWLSRLAFPGRARWICSQGALMTFTAEQLATCAEREVKQRRRVYPRWIEDRRMPQAFADEQVAMMEQSARNYRTKAEAAKGELFGGTA
jgi:hypothetical protein